MGQGYLLTGNPKEAIRAYHQIKQGLAVRDPAKIEQAVKDLRECMAQRSETDKQAAEGILAWLDVPAPALPAERIAAFKAWWPKLPDPVKAAIKEAEERLNGKGRLLVRKSGTEPLVRIMAEGDDEALVRDVVGGVKSAVTAAARAA